MSQLPAQADSAQPKLEEAANKGIRAILVTVVVSLALGVVKIIAGLLGHSYALIADGVESILDVISGLSVAGSLKIAAQPPDEEYPFGYGKVEPTAATVDCRRSVGRGSHYCYSEHARDSHTWHHAPAPFTLDCAGRGGRGYKEVLFRFLFRTGESIASKAMQTDAWHHRSDSLTSLAAFIGISIALWGGTGYESADDWAALFAAGVIAFNGVRLFRRAWREIMDASLPDKIIDNIRDIARRVDGVAGIDMCRVRKSGLGLWVDIHVEVHGDMTVRDGHEIAHRVKDALVASKHNVMDAVVHIEPMDTD